MEHVLDKVKSTGGLLEAVSHKWGLHLYDLCKAKGWPIVLCLLSANGACSQYSLFRSLKLSKEAIAHALSILEKRNLCSMVRSTTFPFTVMVDLTPQGRELVATPLKDLPALLWKLAYTTRPLVSADLADRRSLEVRRGHSRLRL